MYGIDLALRNVCAYLVARGRADETLSRSWAARADVAKARKLPKVAGPVGRVGFILHQMVPKVKLDHEVEGAIHAPKFM